MGAGLLGLFLIAAALLLFACPWWIGLSLLLCAAGLVPGGFLLRKIWLRRRERNFAHEMSARDLAQAEVLSRQEREGASALQRNFKAALDTLRNSHLKDLGNPLYVLPWYLVIGDSGSGKSSSIAGARLHSPLDQAGGEEPSDTAQCEWWFFEQAVVMDTAGRYAMPPHEGQDQEEWQKLLSLLVKYRRKEPLNGVIVTLATDRLQEAAEEQLEKEGSAIRRRIDELMRALGVRVPVYLLVTKCDLIHGMELFSRQLRASALDQPLGVINPDFLQGDQEGFPERAFDTVYQRLRNLRLQMMHKPQESSAAAELLLFPEEFKTLKSALLTFASHAFGANPYQETPVLRGVFFSSARQEGKGRCHFPHGTGRAGAEEAPHGSGRGLFLHDFFARTLPRDRSLLTPTRNYLQWRTLTGNLGLTCWVLLGLALCSLLTFSFMKNIKTIRHFSHGFSKAAPLRGDLPSDLAAMERLRQEILKVEEQNRHWWVPRFGLTESVKVEKGLKERFCRQFQGMILSPFDKQMAAGVSAISPATPDDLYAQYLVHLVRRINVLKGRLDQEDLAALKARPQPEYFSLFDAPLAAGTPEARKAFGLLYLSALIWREDAVQMGKESAQLQSWLKQLVAVKGGDLRCLALWVDRQSGLPAVTLKEFWEGSATAEAEKSVAPCFTRKGKEALDGLTGELEGALPASAPVAAWKASLADWHRRSALEAWRVFAVDFHKGEGRLRGQAEWQQAAARMASEQGPYFALLNRMTRELEPQVGEAAVPPWLEQLYLFQSARAEGALAGSAAIDQAAQGSKKILSSIRKNVGQEAGARKLEAELALSHACREYCSALAAITPAVASRSQVFLLASQTFGEDPATGRSPCYIAASAAARLRAGIPGAGAGADPLFEQLLNGPLRFLWSYLRQESACQLQDLWEEQVLAATTGMTSQQAIPALLGPDGLAWRFVKGPAAPFLSRTISGYRAKETLGGRITFEEELFSFMRKGAQAQAAVMALSRPQHYSVGIRGLPTDTNSEARIKPHATKLELQCGGTVQTLANYNYPVGRTFSWAPDACGDLLFQIEVGDLVLTRHYPGQQGFPDFLKELRGGRRTFTPRDFPGERGALERMGVKSITVNYQIMGSGPILQQSATLSGQAPRNIARGWSH